MDDFSLASLSESKSEWCARLVGIFTPAIIAGLRSIFEEAVTLCKDNDEEDKYLLTFQTFLRRVPKWNKTIIETEQKRISDTSGCNYLEDLVTCVHIIQLKALTCIRVGQEQKKVDVKVPSVEDFVHKVYIATARKVYANVYLFDADAAPLQIQKHNRELELIVRECIMDTIRSSMPVEDILRSYLAETEEEETTIQEEVLEKSAPDVEEVAAAVKEVQVQDESQDVASQEQDISSNENVVISVANKQQSLSFSDVDKAITSNGIQFNIDAPKTIERLAALEADAKRNVKPDNDVDDDDMPLRIGEEVRLEFADISDLGRPISVDDTPILNIETL